MVSLHAQQKRGSGPPPLYHTREDFVGKRKLIDTSLILDCGGDPGVLYSQASTVVNNMTSFDRSQELFTSVIRLSNQFLARTS
jgi:hypothetical protein